MRSVNTSSQAGDKQQHQNSVKLFTISPGQSKVNLSSVLIKKFKPKRELTAERLKENDDVMRKTFDSIPVQKKNSLDLYSFSNIQEPA